jgi:large subunit ribosomal protein L24
MNKLRTGDQVVVLSGRDKGRTGSITRVLPGGMVLVDGVNVTKKHQRANPQRNQPGGKKADRVGVKTLADGKRVRFLKSNNEMIDVK